MIMEPQEVTDLEIAFPADITKLLPAWDALPERFQRDQDPWCAVASSWFYNGIHSGIFVPKKGIDLQTALRHLKCILGSFQPKHEHKIAGAGFLMSEWFDKFQSV